MPSDRFHALAQAVAADLGTPGTRDLLPRGSNVDSQEPQQFSHFPALGTPGTPGTHVFDDTRRETHEFGLATKSFGHATTEAAKAIRTSLLLPSDAAGLLHHLRVDLCCRVWSAGDMLMIGPTHRCPPALVIAAQALWWELTDLVTAEEEDRHV